MSETPKPPRRAYVLDLRVEADTRKDLIGYLRNFQNQLHADEVSNGVTGGYSIGATYSLSVDETISHETWVMALESYLNEIEKANEKAA